MHARILTDEESRIMPVAGGGFEQCYNAQAVVAAESLLVIAVDVVQAPNDKQQIAPMLEKVDALLPSSGQQRSFVISTGATGVLALSSSLPITTRPPQRSAQASTSFLWQA